MSNAIRFALTVTIVCLFVAGSVILVTGCGMPPGAIAVAAVVAGVAAASGGSTEDSSVLILPLVYGPAGPPLSWAKRAGGIGSEQGYGISVFPDDSLVITGIFWDTATFGAGEGNETSLVPAGDGDVYIARYNPDGTLSWAKSAGGIDWDEGQSISALSDGSAIITGYFEITATFGAGETNETVLTAVGTRDIFIAKYNPDGTLAWAKSAGSIDWDEGYGVAAFSDGSAVMTGFFENSATFGAGEGNETVFSQVSGTAIFIAKYNADGTLAWVKSASGLTYDDAGFGISTISDGSVAVTGIFGDNATFGAGEGNETTLASLGSCDIFVAKYNSDGTLAWAKGAGSEYYEFSFGICTFPDGSVAVTGELSLKGVIFGAGENNEITALAEGDRDIFIARYNPDGTIAWAKRAGTDYIKSYGITALPDGSAIIAGPYRGWVGFGRCTLNRTMLMSVADSYDIFIAKYNPDGKFAWARGAGGGNSDYCYGISAFPDGSMVVTGSFNGTTVFGAEEENETFLYSAGFDDIFIAKFNP
jgi:uncharacterized delta-60 repeat protein